MARRKKRNNIREHDSRDRWLVSYADFMTLLFAFFVVLYATSEKDKDKGKELEESIKKYLVKIQVFGGAGGGGDQSLKKLLNQGGPNSVSNLERPLDKYKRSKTAQSEKVLKLQLSLEKKLEQSLSQKQLDKFVHDVIDDEWGVRIVLSSSYLFTQKNIYFRKDALVALNKIGLILSQLKRPLLIEGHAMDIDIRSNNKDIPSSWELSSLRATRILRYFSKKFSIAPNLLSLSAHGSQRPIVPDKSDRRNDRIEILILSGDSPI
jgi:chemotaxis protein MotB